MSSSSSDVKDKKKPRVRSGSVPTKASSRGSRIVPSVFGCCLPGLENPEFSIELKHDLSDKMSGFLPEDFEVSGREWSFSPVKSPAERALTGKPSLPSRSSRSKSSSRKLGNQRPKSLHIIAKHKGYPAASSSNRAKSLRSEKVKLRGLSDDCKLPGNNPELQLSLSKKLSKGGLTLPKLREMTSASTISSEYYDDRSPVFHHGLSSTSSSKLGLSRMGSLDDDNQYGGEEGAKPMYSFSSLNSRARMFSEGQSQHEDKRPVWSPKSSTSTEQLPEILMLTSLSTPREMRVKAFSEEVQSKLGRQSSKPLALENDVSSNRSSSPEIVAMEGKGNKVERGRTM